MMRKVALAGLILLTLSYPFLVYFSLPFAIHPWLLLGVAALWALRALVSREEIMAWGPVVVALGLFVWGRESSVLFYPVLVNGFFLFWFGLSLKYPPPVIERLARLMDPELPPEGVRYTRQVTWVWCAFFLLNGAMAAVTVAVDDLELWTLYNGLISYLIMAGLMAGEYLLRRRIMRANGHA